METAIRLLCDCEAGEIEAGDVRLEASATALDLINGEAKS